MEIKLKEAVEELKRELGEKKETKLRMMVGVDGFVDEICEVVDKRQDFEKYTKIVKIEDLGNRIVRASGMSTNIEVVNKQTKLGGNGPIFANALLEYGVKLTYVGAIGKPDIHAVFKEMVSKCEEAYSICEPGHTDCLEFEDGKVMMGKHSSLKEITWESLKEVLGGAEKIAEYIKKSELFGMENWTMIPKMSEIWEGLIEEVFPMLGEGEKPLAFFDLADPEKRTEQDKARAMELISKFEDKFKVILGLNEKELYEIADTMKIGYDLKEEKGEVLRKTVMKVSEKLGIYCLVVHLMKEACCCINGEYEAVDGPYCEKPVLTTGAGDNFNAGLCLAQALGLGAKSSLLMGVASSGFYVRNGRSATIVEQMKFLEDWKNDSM